MNYINENNFTEHNDTDRRSLSTSRHQIIKNNKNNEL